MRLFIAIDLPHPLQKKLSAFKQEFLHCRWVPEDHLHLTLRFVGDAEEELAKNIQLSLQSIQAQPIELSLIGLGCFPNERYPRVLWIGMEANQGLEKLQKTIEQKLQELGIFAETRPFTPHITLARFKSPNPKGLSNFLAHHGGFHSDPFRVEEFYLYSSTLSPKGAIHEKIGTYPLQIYF